MVDNSKKLVPLGGILGIPWYLFLALFLMNRYELVVRTPQEKGQVWIYLTLSSRDSTKCVGFNKTTCFSSKQHLDKNIQSGSNKQLYVQFNTGIAHEKCILLRWKKKACTKRIRCSISNMDREDTFTVLQQ